MLADTLVPSLIVLILCASVLAPVLFKHQRQMALIANGVDPQAPPARHAESTSRQERAMRQTALGLALTLGLATIGFGPWLLGGLIPLFLGLAKLLAVKLEQPAVSQAR